MPGPGRQAGVPDAGRVVEPCAVAAHRDHLAPTALLVVMVGVDQAVAVTSASAATHAPGVRAAGELVQARVAVAAYPAWASLENETGSARLVVGALGDPL